MRAYQLPAYRPPAYRPPNLRRIGRATMAGPHIGQLGAMTGTDWLELLGGGIVGGIGVNGLLGNFRDPNAVSIALNLVLTAVGGMLFVRNFAKMVA